MTSLSRFLAYPPRNGQELGHHSIRLSASQILSAASAGFVMHAADGWFVPIFFVWNYSMLFSIVNLAIALHSYHTASVLFGGIPWSLVFPFRSQSDFWFGAQTNKSSRDEEIISYQVVLRDISCIACFIAGMRDIFSSSSRKWKINYGIWAKTEMIIYDNFKKKVPYLWFAEFEIRRIQVFDMQLPRTSKL